MGEFIVGIAAIAFFAIPIYFIARSSRKDWQKIESRATADHDPGGWRPDSSGGTAERYFDGSTLTSWSRDVPQGETATDECRSAILERAIMRAVSRAGSVEYRAPFNAVVIYKSKPVNHVLHGILTLLTFLVWALVWITLTQRSGERREVLEVDQFGNLAASTAISTGAAARP
jgi:hypothetical protein